MPLAHPTGEIFFAWGLLPFFISALPAFEASAKGFGMSTAYRIKPGSIEKQWLLGTDIQPAPIPPGRA